MKALDFIYMFIDPLRCRRSCFCGLLPAAILSFLIIYFIGSICIAPGYTERLSFMTVAFTDPMPNTTINECETECKLDETKALPKGIVSRTTNFKLRPLWGSPKKKNESTSTNLFAAAVGIKQKDLVNKMVRKFLSCNFVVILFHYDGNVDKWKSFDWNDKAIHVSALSQTKWWFAKRFLHPDVVAEYSYIFLWDEDLGVENFHPERYISIIQSEGLEVSQPGLDPAKSTSVHHQITARRRRSTVHRRVPRPGCDRSTSPPCTGWVEMMAPVFSRAAWRCVWYMIQNDLIYAWGLDKQLGYCAQGDRIKNVGVVDAEYIIHFGRPTLGGADEEMTSSATNQTVSKNGTSIKIPKPKHLHLGPRGYVRKRSGEELVIFGERWKKAVQEDKCWVDPFQKPSK